MPYVMVDIESDGPIPGTEDYSMICFGAVLVDETLSKTFYGKLRPISSKWLPEALAVSGFTREETLRFPDARLTMNEFEAWLATHCPNAPAFISDNNGFDYSFINWYFHHFIGLNRLATPRPISDRSTKGWSETFVATSNTSAEPYMTTTRLTMP